MSGNGINDPLKPFAAIVQPSAELEAKQLLDAYVVPNYGRLSLVPERGKGVWLWDARGQKYLDFGGGVAVTSLGHSPAVILQALREQSERLIHCSNWYQIPGQGHLGKFLVETVMKTPGKCFFCNSGAEANEGLIKLARKFGHATPLANGAARTEILTFTNSFHGRTYGGISATGQDKVKHGFAPLVPGFRHLPFNDLAAFQAAVSEETVAVLLEIVQGEGGVTVATPEFLLGLAEVCRERNILLLIDEVQAGLGRCGEWCSWQAALAGAGAGAAAANFQPDAVSWAKGLGGGFPIGAVWIRQRPIHPSQPKSALCDILAPGSHGTTYGGNPLGCAVSLAVLREIDQKRLCPAVTHQERRIREAVEEWKSPFVKRVKGLGLLLGFELCSEKLQHAPGFQEGTLPSMFLVNLLMQNGLLVVAAGPDVVRWLPPLNVTDAEVDEALDLMRQVLALLE